MKIEVVAYNPQWPDQFQSIKSELAEILKNLNPMIEHIGSTSVPGLAAKPIIDIAVGLNSVDDLDSTIIPMTINQYIYFKAFNAMMPERRLFVGIHEDEEFKNFKSIYSEDDEIPHERLNHLRKSHVHIWEHGSNEWTRHIAFRDYLRASPLVAEKYAALKKQLSMRNWKDGMEYNDGKNSFIKSEEAKAIEWYYRNSSGLSSK